MMELQHRGRVSNQMMDRRSSLRGLGLATVALPAAGSGGEGARHAFGLPATRGREGSEKGMDGHPGDFSLFRNVLPQSFTSRRRA